MFYTFLSDVSGFLLILTIPFYLMFYAFVDVNHPFLPDVSGILLMLITLFYLMS